MPFHSVNSPLLDPVNRRRPSGVHATTLIGCLILFKDECSSLAATVSTAFAGRAVGGRICITSVSSARSRACFNWEPLFSHQRYSFEKVSLPPSKLLPGNMVVCIEAIGQGSSYSPSRALLHVKLCSVAGMAALLTSAFPKSTFVARRKISIHFSRPCLLGQYPSARLADVAWPTNRLIGYVRDQRARMHCAIKQKVARC